MTSASESYRSGVVMALLALLGLALVYLINLNRLLRSTPEQFRQLTEPWTREQIIETHERLAQKPITTASYSAHLPPKLNRRYIVTGGSGMVGGYIVLQLLERGQPPESIRIVDFQAPHRSDMAEGPAAAVSFHKVDISSAQQTDAAFAAPWPASVASLPLTIFHSAAVIIPSARSQLVSGFCDAVNVGGTANILAAARRVGADIFISTSSASIAIRPVELWRGWSEPRYFAQMLDETDFFAGPLRPHREFFGNYPYSKARAERLVCGANGPEMRTGSIRPANGVYGHLTDNMIGKPLSVQDHHSWTNHIVQSFVHGINCALAHLQFEAVLADPASATSPQAGRPFVVTDPCPPITYGALYDLMTTVAATPFRSISIPPVPMLLLSYVVEFYNLLPARLPFLAGILPRIPGDVVYLEPGLFSICTHLVGNMADAQKSVAEGGLGYRGVLTSLEGMCQEVIEWNREQEQHAKTWAGSSTGTQAGGKPGLKAYLNSVSLAEEVRRLSGISETIKNY